MAHVSRVPFLVRIASPSIPYESGFAICTLIRLQSIWFGGGGAPSTSLLQRIRANSATTPEYEFQAVTIDRGAKQRIVGAV